MSISEQPIASSAEESIASAGLVPGIHSRPHAPVHVHTTPKTPKLGEELPLFCEQCGYNLNGLPVTRCDACQTLHFRCPECGHHQVINTLRPATQRILGRLRSWAVVWIVFLKINWFGWILFGWFAYGYDTLRSYSYRLRIDEILGICILAGLFALISRILLMRWKKSWLVGTILGALVILAMMLGGVYRIIDRSQYDDLSGRIYTDDNVMRIAYAFGSCLFCGLISWPIWQLAVHLLLPKRTGQSLIAWQKSLSENDPDPGVAAKILHH